MFYLIFFSVICIIRELLSVSLSDNRSDGVRGSEEEIKTELNVAACLNPSSPIWVFQVCPHFHWSISLKDCLPNSLSLLLTKEGVKGCQVTTFTVKLNFQIWRKMGVFHYFRLFYAKSSICKIIQPYSTPRMVMVSQSCWFDRVRFVQMCLSVCNW